MAGRPPVVEAQQFLKGRHVGHGEVEPSLDQLVFAPLALASGALVLHGEEFVRFGGCLVVDHQFETGDPCSSPREISNGAGDLEDDDAVRSKRGRVGTQLKDTLRPAIERLAQPRERRADAPGLRFPGWNEGFPAAAAQWWRDMVSGRKDQERTFRHLSFLPCRFARLRAHVPHVQLLGNDGLDRLLPDRENAAPLNVETELLGLGITDLAEAARDGGRL